jgi:acyl-coenzyme A thioesterase PaaI-like protein
MSESIFVAGDERARSDGPFSRDDAAGRFGGDSGGDSRGGGGGDSAGDGRITMAIHPTEHARGPWDPAALHGGAPAALLTSVFEHMEPGAELRIARLGFELLRPIPFAPLRLSARIVRPGRRVQELAGELSATDPASGRQQTICRASALRVREVTAEVAAAAGSATRPGARPGEGGDDDRDGDAGDAPLPPPDTATPVLFSLNDSAGPSFAASAMEMRWLDDPKALGPARVWMRLRHPLLPGEEPTPLARLAATADFGNGVGAALAFERFLFINADLTLHLHRQPRGEWIGIDARTLLDSGGTGLAESVLHDAHGPVGRAFQTLVVQPR